MPFGYRFYQLEEVLIDNLRHLPINNEKGPPTRCAVPSLQGALHLDFALGQRSFSHYLNWTYTRDQVGAQVGYQVVAVLLYLDSYTQEMAWWDTKYESQS